MTKGEMDAVRQIVREEMERVQTETANFIFNKITEGRNKPWHPSDEAALEKYLEYAIKDWAHNFSRSELSIKYKIAKIIKAEGVKV